MAISATTHPQEIPPQLEWRAFRKAVNATQPATAIAHTRRSVSAGIRSALYALP